MAKGLFTFDTALFSPDRKYRYMLKRNWNPEKKDPKTCMFVMLNPSTADEVTNDPTIRRCINFAQRFGADELLVCNLYAFRTPYPERLFQVRFDPVGPENDKIVTELVWESELVICAWGANGVEDRAKYVKAMIPESKRFCLGLNKDGSPKHPLYLSKETELIKY